MRQSTFTNENSNESFRNAWVAKSLSKIPSGKKVLDAGAGEMFFKKDCIHLKYTSQDFGKYDGRGNSVGLQTNTWQPDKIDIISDITSIPVKKGSFDVILCTEVLEHLPYPIKAIEEFGRILNKGGVLILTAPFCSLTHYAPYYFSNGFSPFWYKQILKDNNFIIKEITPYGNYFEYLSQELRRLPEVTKRYSTKFLPIVLNMVIFLAITILAKLSKSDKGSSELLCFGHCVIASKK